jgi:hypothetical protein
MPEPSRLARGKKEGDELMPYKSDAQRKAMHAKADAGEISKAVIQEMDQKSKGMKLPAKAPPPPKFKKKR